MSVSISCPGIERKSSRAERKSVTVCFIEPPFLRVSSRGRIVFLSPSMLIQGCGAVNLSLDASSIDIVAKIL
jgi:hypothetical protein